VITAWGSGFEGDWQPAYGPWVEALGICVQAIDAEQLQRTLGPCGLPVAQLVPQLRGTRPKTPDSPILKRDDQRLRLFDAVVQFLMALAEEVPVLLVIDDLQWADRDSLLLLRHLARFLVHSRLLVVAAYREPELALNDQAPFIDLLPILEREIDFRHLAIHGFSRGEVAE